MSTSPTASGTRTMPRTLPAVYYTDEAHYRRELEHFFFSQWVCVGRADQIPAAGNFFRRDVAGESLIVLRDDAGGVRAFYNLCRHRGTRICEKDEGTFPARRITCPYHAWTYGLNGNLLGAAHMAETPGFSVDDFPLHQVKTELWDGHIFVNLADEPVRPLAEQLGVLVEKFRPWRMADLRLGKRVVYPIQANWKLVVQNYSECLHCPMVHPALAKLSHYMSGNNEPAQWNYLGGRMDLNPGVKTMTMSGQSNRALLPELGEEEKRHVYYYWVMPNLLLSLHPDYMVTYTIWPKNPRQSEIICEFHFHKDEIGKPGFTPEDAFEFWDLTNRQDWHVSELSQLGIGSRGYVPGPYSMREGLLHELDKLMLAAVEANVRRDQ